VKHVPEVRVSVQTILGAHITRVLLRNSVVIDELSPSDTHFLSLAASTGTESEEVSPSRARRLSRVLGYGSSRRRDPDQRRSMRQTIKVEHYT
jgi:hypothetical protein